MARLLYTDTHPFAAAVYQLGSANQPINRTIITSSRLAARSLGVPYQSLSHLAIKQVEQNGWAIASVLKAKSVFRQVVQDRVQPMDRLGTMNAWLPTVRSLLQSSPDLDAISGTLSERAQILMQVARAFQTALHQERLIDLSELYWWAVNLHPQSRPVFIYGYFQPRQAELSWMNAIAASDSLIFLPALDAPHFEDVRASVNWLVQKGWETDTVPVMNSTLGEHLSQLFIGTGSEVADQLPEPAEQRGVSAYSYSTFHAEVRGTLAQVKALLTSGTPAREIAIVARDEVAYGPRLIDVAWEYDVPLRALYATPLLNTRLGAWLSLLIEVMDTEYPFEATAKLLRHPLCSNPDGEFWAAVRGLHPVGFAQWRAIAQDNLSLDLSPLLKINQLERRDSWVAWWLNLFRIFDLRKRCARWARESIAFNTLQQGLVELSKPENDKLNWPKMRQEFQELLEVLSVPAQPGRGGVELHKPTSVAGTRYAHIFVVGMAEGVLPAPVSNDPVLDFFERQQLQSKGVALPTAATLARQEALSFFALLQTVTGRVTFSYPKLNNRQEQVPSPYLKQLCLEATEPFPLPIASLEELRRVVVRHENMPDAIAPEDTVLPHAIHAFQVEQSRESSHPPNEYDGVLGIPFDYKDWTFSVSQLRNLGQCPFKWFADKILQLGAPEEIEDDLSPSQIGQLYHRVLELILAERQQNKGLEITDAALLEQKFTVAEGELQLSNLPIWELRRDEHLRCLFLALNDPDFLPTGAEPVLLERSFEGEWYGLKVRGRVDRIDRTENGMVLIDYKTGKSRPSGIKDQNGKACIDVQLPLYQEAAAPYLCSDEPVDTAYYYSIRGRRKMTVAKGASPSNVSQAIAQCKAYLEKGHYPVQPDSAQLACKYCDFDALCRRGERVSRKEDKHGTD